MKTIALIFALLIAACGNDDSAPPAPDCAHDKALCDDGPPDTSVTPAGRVDSHNKSIEEPWALYQIQWPSYQSCLYQGAYVNCFTSLYPRKFLAAWSETNWDSWRWSYLDTFGANISYNGIYNHQGNFPLKCEACAWTSAQDKRCTQGVTGYHASWTTNDVTFNVPASALQWFSHPPQSTAYYSLECWVKTGFNWALPIVQADLRFRRWFTLAP